MAVQQRKVTSSRKAMRNSHSHLDVKLLVSCKKCTKKIMPHRVCNNCGYYKNKRIINVEK